MKKTTSIRIDQDVWNTGKKQAIDKDMRIGEYVEDLIKEKINK